MTRWPRFKSFVNTPADSPNGVLLDLSITSSSPSKDSIDSTGPKISSLQISIESLQSVKIAGVRKLPEQISRPLKSFSGLEPPANNVAPEDFPELINRIILSRCALLIN